MPPRTEITEDYFRTRCVVTEAGCWEWQLTCNTKGYGRTGAGMAEYGEQLAHRLAYRALVGPISGEIDHLCRNRRCVFVGHLEDVAHQANMQRTPLNSYIAARAAQTICARGHAYTPENTGRSSGQRYCRTCKRERMTERRHTATSPRRA